LKAGGDLHRVDLELVGADIAAASAEQTMELDEALRLLQAENPRAAEVVELHYFAGLTIEHIAEVKKLSTRSIDRDWRFARAWLRDALRP
jgi:RNA polymerase sigma factor (sigma-70 family)